MANELLICFHSENYETYGVNLLDLAPNDRPHLKRLMGLRCLLSHPALYSLTFRSVARKVWLFEKNYPRTARASPCLDFSLKLLKNWVSRMGETFAITSGFFINGGH